jgi:hypothetical protein
VGTSLAASAARGNHPLIPAWLRDDESAGAEADPGASGTQPDGGVVVPVGSPQRPDVNFARTFAPARSAISRTIGYVSTGGSNPRGGRGQRGGGRQRSAQQRARSAIGQYVRARGGASRVAGRLSIATDVAARLYDALDRIARDGFDAALAALGISLDDRSASAMADALMSLVIDADAASLDGILDVSDARAACDETFISLYEQGHTFSTITSDLVPGIIKTFAVNAACLLITREIGTSVVDRPRTENDSLSVQATIRSVVEAAVSLELPQRSDRLSIRDVRTAIRSAYRGAFRILSASR